CGAEPNRRSETQRLRDPRPAPALHHGEERGVRSLPDVWSEVDLWSVEDVLIALDRLHAFDEAVECQVGASIFQPGDRQVRGDVSIDRANVWIDVVLGLVGCDKLMY